MTKSNHT